MMSLESSFLMRSPEEASNKSPEGTISVGETVGTIVEGAGVGGLHKTLSKDPIMFPKRDVSLSVRRKIEKIQDLK